MNNDGLNSFVNGWVLLVELFVGDCINAHIHALWPQVSGVRDWNIIKNFH